MRPPPPPVDIELSDVEDVTRLSHEELLKTPHDKKKWRCCVEDCMGYSMVRDYGVLPLVYWKKKWTDLRVYVFFCSKHWPKVKNNSGYEFTQKPGPGINQLDK